MAVRRRTRKSSGTSPVTGDLRPEFGHERVYRTVVREPEMDVDNPSLALRTGTHVHVHPLRPLCRLARGQRDGCSHPALQNPTPVATERTKAMAQWIERCAHIARRNASRRAIVSILLVPFVSVIAFSGLCGADASVSASATVAAPVTFDGPTAVVANKSDAWIANIEGDSVTEVSASDGSLVQNIKGSSYKFDAPVAMAIYGSDVWVANQGTEWFGGTQPGSVTEFSASTGQLIRVVKGAGFELHPAGRRSDERDRCVGR